MHPPVEYILFDLDNTLYSSRWGLEQNVSRRINEYISRHLNMPMEDAWALRNERVRGRYGTSLEWLRAEQGFDDAETERYYAAIHPENEADALAPDPELRSLLLSFGLPLGILTNSIREHAVRILSKLGVLDLFPSIFDIRGNGLKGKPAETAYRRVLDETGQRPETCLFVDDVARNVEAYRALGGAGLYYDEKNRRPGFSPPENRITALEEIRRFL